MDYHTSLLVSCCGAYDDSGIGTGGLVCVHDGRAVVIDKMDSTGLCQADGMIYRSVRSMRSVIGYDGEGIKYWLRVPLTKDVHDILVRDGTIVCASTGQNQICWFDPLGNLINRWQAQGEGDAWHLNCLCYAGGRLYASAFGEFETHRGWTAGCLNTGFVFDVATSEKVVTGLSGPHSPRCVDGSWIICNSHTKTLTIQDGASNVRQVQLGGFSRGLAYDETYLYVGESSNRKDPIVHDFSFVSILDRRSLAHVDKIRMPFPEIYEIVLLPPEIAANMVAKKERFAFDFNDERIKALENQVERGYDEIRKLKYSLSQERSASLRYRLSRIKQRVVRAVTSR